MRFLVILAYVLATLTTTAFFAVDARAVNLSWNATGGGDADKASNWTPSQIPGLADDLTFGLSNTYTVDWSNSISNVDTIDVSAGDVIFEDLGSTDLTTTGLLEVGDNSGGMATLALDGGMWTAGSSIRIGFQAADDGRLEVAGNAALNVLSSLAVGFRGDGELLLTEGTIDVTGNLNAASATTGSTNGTATIEVSDTFDVTGTTNLGASAGGTATLRVIGGGEYASGGATTISAGSLLEVLGGTYNANSSLTLASATSMLTVDGDTLNAKAGLDNSAAGTFNFFDGTLTVTGGAFQPNAGGSADDYTIEGPTAAEMPHLKLGTGATASIGHDLTIGDVNRGMLSVTNGATISNRVGQIGKLPGSVGSVTVDGVSSTWTNSGSLTVGILGDGTLTIQNGGTVSSAGSVIGFNPGSMSTATVNGAGSTWTNAGDLFVGHSGDGTLNILNGGTVSSTSAFIGFFFSGTAGTALVDGAGSTWTNTGDFYVGGTPSTAEGDGSLTVQSGGVVDVTGLTKIWDDGIITITGGTFNASSKVDIDGGTLLVDGVGSTLTSSSGLTVGILGDGTLTIQNGGTVSSAGGVIGFNPGSMNTATVNGTGSTWTNAGNLFVGHSGDGTLNILNGGTVSSTSAFIGFFFSSTAGTALVDGTGSTWTNTGDFYVGGTPSTAEGDGSLTVQSGGVVDVTGLTKIWDDGTITITGGTFNASGNVDIDGGTLQVDGAMNMLNSASLTNQNGGTIAGTGVIDLGEMIFFNEGILSPGSSAGTLTLSNGAYTQMLSGTLAIEIGGTVQGTDYDLLSVDNEAKLGGTLDVTLINGFSPAAGNSFDILTTTNGIFNAFTTVNLPSLSGGLAWNVNQGANTLSLAVGIAGDYNNDGTVDAADYTVWRDNEGAVAGTLPNDADGGVIGAAQYSSWVANFGATASVSTSVPEPGALALAIFAALGMLARRR